MTSAPEQPPATTKPAYDVEALLFSGTPTRVLRARQTADNRPVVLKVVPSDGDQTANSIRHEFEIATRLQGQHVVHAYGLLADHEQQTLVLEDFGGESLNNIVDAEQLPLDEVLDIAAQVAAGLAEMHAAHVIHKDINPSNIVYNRSTRTAKIIDFGISTCLTREQTDIATAHVLEGSLRYLSPEQTGRMNRAIDYRTDFYSLGATLYELITRRPLFTATEPIEWLHCHIAHQPTPPHHIDSKIPEPLSDLTMKLLAKDAEQRYRSARGIKADLEHCRDSLRSEGTIAPFTLGAHDLPDRFQIPQRLYGRDNELQALLAAYDRVAAGAAELVAVGGYSGIGKSCLVRELYKPITERRGFFLAGKFDQLHRSSPYSALASAMRDFVRQILAEPELRLERWRQRLQTGLGSHGQLIVNVVPELELVVGPQPALVDLPPQRAEWRFQRAFLRFLHAVCASEHPLVLFLDDLQWADSATLGLLERLVRDPDAGHLLLIGAYRDNEVHPAHPLHRGLARLRQDGWPLRELTLKPLGTPELTQLLADTFFVRPAQARPLAELVQQKTAGNPFFTEEFLKLLHRHDLIWFDATAGTWCWDLERIEAQQITDNVVDLMQQRLRALDPHARQLLEVAACIGNRFELGILLVVSDQSPATIGAHLRAAMSAGLVAPIGDAYQLLYLGEDTAPDSVQLELAFAHDRIQQAAYALLDATARGQAHLRIGRLLVNRLTRDQQDQYLFEITDHLNLAASLISSAAERDHLRRLNLSAGLRARAAAAYRAAWDYCAMALSLLSASSWQDDRLTTLSMHSAAAEAAYYLGNYETAERLVKSALPHAKDEIEAGSLNETYMALLVAGGRHAEALALGKPVLARLEIHYPRHARLHHVIRARTYLRWRLRNVSTESLLDLPFAVDPRARVAMRVGERMSSAAMQVEPLLMPIMIVAGVVGALDFGITERSPVAIGGFGILMCYEGRITEGQRFSEVAQKLCERFPQDPVDGRVRAGTAIFAQPWYEPLSATLEPLRTAYSRCYEGGDFEGAVQAGTGYLAHVFLSGIPLDHVQRECTTWGEALIRMHQGETAEWLARLQQVLANLRGESATPALLKGVHYDIDRELPSMRKRGAGYGMLHALGMQALLSALFAGPAQSVAHADAMQPMLLGADYTCEGALFHFVDALVRLSAVRAPQRAARRRVLKAVRASERAVARWGRHSPANFGAKWALLRAERHRVLGEHWLALLNYERAVALAIEHAHPGDEAMALEACAALHADAGSPHAAENCLRRAHGAYQRWGAIAKVRELELTHGWLNAAATTRRDSLTSSISSEHSLTEVDITSLRKALKAIAEEYVFSRVLRAIITTSLEFAGAQRGVLLLRDTNARLCVEAEASVDAAEPAILQSIPVSACDTVCHAVINYVARVRRGLVVHDARERSPELPALHADEYIRRNGIRSILCVPIVAGTDTGTAGLIGMIYLENNRAVHSFTEQRFGMLEIIGMAAAGRLELSRKAAVDALTQLFNRGYFESMLHQEFVNARRRGRQLSLLFGDVDHFKRFNDEHGHQLGDRVLQAVAAAVKGACREDDLVSRYGGEEVAVLLPETGAELALDVAERVRAAVERLSIEHDGKALGVTMSVGIAALTDAMIDERALLRAADGALYRAKGEGRNRVYAADPDAASRPC
jgi:histidine kinase